MSFLAGVIVGIWLVGLAALIGAALALRHETELRNLETARKGRDEIRARIRAAASRNKLRVVQ